MRDKQQFHHKKVNGRYRVFDHSQQVGSEDMCLADCSQEWMAEVITYLRNQGLPYKPDITYQDYLTLKTRMESSK